jgi:putative redox protein
MMIDLDGKKARAHFDGMTLETGEGTASPFNLLIASLGACAILSAEAYCSRKQLPLEGFKININVERHPETRLAQEIAMELVIPSNFPAEEVPRLIRAAGTCFVKKHFDNPPVFTTTVMQV